MMLFLIAALLLLLAAIPAVIGNGIAPFPVAKPHVNLESCTYEQDRERIQMSVHWTPTSTEGQDSIKRYEVQYAIAGTNNWTQISDNILGFPEHSHYHEIQTIYSKADVGQSITTGVFRISYSTTGVHSVDPNKVAVTPPVSHDATESEMKAALESLENIHSVNVIRTGPDPQGGYQWTVTFLPSDLYPELNHGNLPLLNIFSNSLDGTWTTGDQISVIKTRAGSSSSHIPCVSECSHIVQGLSSNTAYTFRVRALATSSIVSEWSVHSTPTKSCKLNAPEAPVLLSLSSLSQNYITLKWQKKKDDTTSVLYFEYQQKCASDIIWTTIRSRVVANSRWTSATSTFLEPNTKCVFRVRGVNEVGTGRYSEPSESFTTLSGPPSPPTDLAFDTSSTNASALLATFGPPKDTSGLEIMNYEIQYREVWSARTGATCWIQLQNTNATSVWITNLLEYRTYSFRVRAVNSAGKSDYAEVLNPERTSIIRERAPSRISTSSAEMTRAETSVGRIPARSTDTSYVNGIGYGGTEGSSGQPGIVLMHPMTVDFIRLPDLIYFYTGSEEVHEVPLSNRHNSVIMYYHIYLWGAGGGSSSNTNGPGGGGGFTSAPVTVLPGDVFTINVGGPGTGTTSSSGGTGGYNGGGFGGAGTDDGGGGGGGASVVKLNDKVILVAGGGGGGGASDYCCANGGGGGGTYGGNGSSADSTVVPRSVLDTKFGRNQYNSVYDENDNRDNVGLPAGHEHLDHGFAPNADYRTLASGGNGGTTTGGNAGVTGSYTVSSAAALNARFVTNHVAVSDSSVDMIVSTNATNGQELYGGKGAGGKEAGGGGGGGYYGGGGGGAGLDGGGGGGGSGFILYEVVHDFASTARLSGKRADGPANVRATSVTSNSVNISWSAPEFGFYSEPVGFAIEKSDGTVSEDYSVVHTASFQTFSYVVENLIPLTSYRFRIHALGRVDTGSYSTSVHVQTLAVPENNWELVKARPVIERGVGAGGRFADPPYANREAFPAGRRGHSLTNINGYTYLFGGYTSGYQCAVGRAAAECIRTPGVTEELWRYDVLTETWSEIFVTQTWPMARELHSMVSLEDSNILLMFGGHNGGPTNAGSSLNDVWVLDVGEPLNVNLNSQETNVDIPVGEQLFTMATASVNTDMCIRSMKVRVTVTRACTASQLQIKIFGPGPSTFPYRQQHTDSTTGSYYHADGSTTTYYDAENDPVLEPAARVSPSVTSGRAFPVLMMDASPTYCTNEMTTETFVFTNEPTEESEVRPAESLSVFTNLPAGGDWTIMLYDRDATPTTTGDDDNNNSGVLNSWDIDFVMEKCIPTYEWTDVSDNIGGVAPSPRFEHAAVVVGGTSVFVYGGRSEDRMLDMYRLDYYHLNEGGTSKWTRLAPAQYVRSRHGRTLLISPYQLLSFGGLVATSRHVSTESKRLDQQVWTRSLITRRMDWKRLNVSTGDGWVPVPRVLFHREQAIAGGSISTQPEILQAVPPGRYSAAAVFLNDDILSKRVQKMAPTSPRLLLFGGYDSTSTFFDDLWQLNLNGLEYNVPDSQVIQDKIDLCEWRMKNPQVLSIWEQSCAGDLPTKDCSLDDVMLHAWCNGNYQSVNNL